MKVRIFNNSGFPCPNYATVQSAGMDIRSTIDFTLAPGERKCIPTGLYLALTPGYEAQLRPRSGLALKHGITLVNTPGTIDADYRGEVGVILINLSGEPYSAARGERIAQMVIADYKQAEWLEMDSIEALGETERGAGGFGHTGKN